LEQHFLPQDGARNLLRLKGKPYVYEEEVRCIGMSPALTQLYRNQMFSSDPPVAALKEALKSVSANRAGYCLPINLKNLIEKITAHPRDDAKFYRTVEEMLAAKNISNSLLCQSAFG
jgi:hypothetical protein